MVAGDVVLLVESSPGLREVLAQHKPALMAQSGIKSPVNKLQKD